MRYGWCLIPAVVMADPNLNSTDKLVYGRIHGLSGDDPEKPYCWASNSWLAGQIGVSSRHIQRSISLLESLGYIKINSKITEKGTSRYLYASHDYIKELSSTPLNRGDVYVTPPTTSLSPPHDIPVTQVIQKSNTELVLKENNKKKAHYPKEDELKEEDFADIAYKYHASVPETKFVWQQLVNWCHAKGKPYVNYRAAMNTWMDKRLESRIEKERYGSKVAVINVE